MIQLFKPTGIDIAAPEQSGELPVKDGIRHTVVTIERKSIEQARQRNKNTRDDDNKDSIVWSAQLCTKSPNPTHRSGWVQIVSTLNEPP